MFDPDFVADEVRGDERRDVVEAYAVCDGSYGAVFGVEHPVP